MPPERHKTECRKIKFTPTVWNMGYALTPLGCIPTGAQIDAIVQMPAPDDKKSTPINPSCCSIFSASLSKFKWNRSASGQVATSRLRISMKCTTPTSIWPLKNYFYWYHWRILFRKEKGVAASMISVESFFKTLRRQSHSLWFKSSNENWYWICSDRWP